MNANDTWYATMQAQMDERAAVGVFASYADLRSNGTGYCYTVYNDGEIVGSGNYRHNKKYKTVEKACAYLEKCGFTKDVS